MSEQKQEEERTHIECVRIRSALASIKALVEDSGTALIEDTYKRPLSNPQKTDIHLMYKVVVFFEKELDKVS